MRYFVMQVSGPVALSDLNGPLYSVSSPTKTPQASTSIGANFTSPLSVSVSASSQHLTYSVPSMLKKELEQSIDEGIQTRMALLESLKNTSPTCPGFLKVCMSKTFRSCVSQPLQFFKSFEIYTQYDCSQGGICINGKRYQVVTVILQCSKWCTAQYSLPSLWLV